MSGSEHDRLRDAATASVATNADLSIYADWLEENGKDLHLAHALRWCVVRGKRPRVSAGWRVASWRPMSKRLHPAVDRVLRLVYDQMTGGQMKGGRRSYHEFGSASATMNAYLALANALRRLRQAYEP